MADWQFWQKDKKTQTENIDLKRQLEELAEKNKFPPFNWPDLWADQEQSTLMQWVPILNLIIEVALLIILIRK